VLDLKVLQKVLWNLWTFFNCFSTKNWFTPLSEKQTDTQSNSYVGVNFQSGRLLGHGNLWQREKFILYWVCSCLWALSRNLLSYHILPPRERLEINM
jgi:hypothetical protein